MKRQVAIAGFLVLLLSGTSYAATGANFVSGNPNNDGQYTPRKVYRPKADDGKPGFWKKELKRSGLSELGGNGKWNPFSGVGRFLKEKDDAYRTKHPDAEAK